MAADSLAQLEQAVAGLSRACERTGGQPIRLRKTGDGPYGTVRVRIEGGTATLGSWEVIAVLHHDKGATRVEPCAPLSPSQVARLREARALCEHCRTVRPRKQTWLLREPDSGQTLQVGSSCLRPLTGALSVKEVLRHARLLGEASARLQATAGEDAARRRLLVGDRYIDTSTFLAHVAAVIRAHRWHPANDPEPTWQKALERMDAREALEPLHLRRAREVRAWAASQSGEDDGYRTRLRSCLANERLSSRELALAASSVRQFNRTLQAEIRLAKGHARAGE